MFFFFLSTLPTLRYRVAGSQSFWEYLGAVNMGMPIVHSLRPRASEPNFGLTGSTKAEKVWAAHFVASLLWIPC